MRIWLRRLARRVWPVLEPTRLGWCVRRDWPDGSHDLFGWHPDRGRSVAAISADESRWATQAVRPGHRVILFNQWSWWRHRDGCRNRGCPGGDADTGRVLPAGYDPPATTAPRVPDAPTPVDPDPLTPPSRWGHS